MVTTGATYQPELNELMKTALELHPVPKTPS